MDNLQVAADRKLRQSAFEALLKGLDIRKEAATWPELRPIYDLDHPQKTYPAQTFCQFWELIQAKKFPDVPLEEAHLEMGKKLTYGYVNGTTIGRLAFSIIPFMTTENFVKIAPQLWDQGLGEYKVDRPAAKKATGQFRHCVLPPLALVGSTIVILQLTKAQNLTYEIAHTTQSGGCYNCDIVFQWE